MLTFVITFEGIFHYYLYCERQTNMNIKVKEIIVSGCTTVNLNVRSCKKINCKASSCVFYIYSYGPEVKRMFHWSRSPCRQTVLFTDVYENIYQGLLIVMKCFLSK